jgi:glycosyltransferase involved in cell wall biosynthesis
VRIAILNWSNRLVGGTGTYLNTVIPLLRRAGHEVALWHEVDAPLDRDSLALPPNTPVWSVEALGLEDALSALQGWRPNLLFAQGLLDPAIEQRTLNVAPAVFFAHNYYGTCISGTKTVTNPTIQPCTRKFGAACLAQYYPRRCGGWSPVTMVREFRKQADRLQLLPRYKAIVTHSAHMQQEYARHGLTAIRVFEVHHGSDLKPAATPRPIKREPGDAWRLLFVGRMDVLKGGRELLKALPRVIQVLQRDVHLVLAGDGPDRLSWQQLAADIRTCEPRLHTEFSGWVGHETIETLFANTDLLVLPSLWPEPFALVGLEAARHGVPVAAFEVGGISDWLRSGVNGHLANGDPPSIDGLAEAIVACLKDPESHARLRDGAARLSANFSFEQHVNALLRIFADVARPAA